MDDTNYRSYLAWSVIAFMLFVTYHMTARMEEEYDNPYLNLTKHDDSLSLTELRELYKTAFIQKPGLIKNTVQFQLNGIFNNRVSLTNEHNFKLLLKPNVKQCSAKNKRRILLVAMVMISPKFIEKRHRIRATWANTSQLNDPDYDLKVFFVVGWWNKDPAVNKQLAEEASVYNDIIQEDFIEDYQNMTTKVLGSFKFVSKQCSNVDFVLRINDDMVPNIKRLVKFLKAIKTENQQVNNLAIGNLLCPKGCLPCWRTCKWNITRWHFPGNKHLPYMEGSAFIVSSDLAINVYNQSRYVYWPLLSDSLEDVYVGMIFHHFQSNFYNIKERISRNLPYSSLEKHKKILINRVNEEFYL